MRVVHRTATDEQEVVLDVADPHVTVADLAEALAGPDAAGAAVSIDDAPLDPDTTLAPAWEEDGLKAIVPFGGARRQRGAGCSHRRPTTGRSSATLT